MRPEIEDTPAVTRLVKIHVAGVCADSEEASAAGEVETAGACDAEGFAAPSGCNVPDPDPPVITAGHQSRPVRAEREASDLPGVPGQFQDRRGAAGCQPPQNCRAVVHSRGHQGGVVSEGEGRKSTRRWEKAEPRLSGPSVPHDHAVLVGRCHGRAIRAPARAVDVALAEKPRDMRPIAHEGRDERPQIFVPGAVGHQRSPSVGCNFPDRTNTLS